MSLIPLIPMFDDQAFLRDYLSSWLIVSVFYSFLCLMITCRNIHKHAIPLMTSVWGLRPLMKKLVPWYDIPFCRQDTPHNFLFFFCVCELLPEPCTSLILPIFLLLKKRLIKTSVRIQNWIFLKTSFLSHFY